MIEYCYIIYSEDSEGDSEIERIYMDQSDAIEYIHEVQETVREKDFFLAPYRIY